MKKGMLKKSILFLIICLSVFFMGGCVELQTEAQKLDKEIKNLGEITLESEPKIAELEETYKNLPSDEIDYVRNAGALISARETYENLLFDAFTESETYASAMEELNAYFDTYTKSVYDISADKEDKILFVQVVMPASNEGALRNPSDAVKQEWATLTGTLKEMSEKYQKEFEKYHVAFRLKINSDSASKTKFFEIENGEVIFNILGQR